MQLSAMFPFNILCAGVGYIYYWDWGPNSGANWLIGSDPDGVSRGIESENVETGTTNYTMCLNQVPSLIWGPVSVEVNGFSLKARRAGDFRVFNGEKQEWDSDSTLRVTCLDNFEVESTKSDSPPQ